MQVDYKLLMINVHILEMWRGNLTTFDLSLLLDAILRTESLLNWLLLVILFFKWISCLKKMRNLINVSSILGLVDGRDLVVIAANLQKILDGLSTTNSITFVLVIFFVYFECRFPMGTNAGNWCSVYCTKIYSRVQGNSPI